jgi:GNAT superfamily N-acetyltransferase
MSPVSGARPASFLDSKLTLQPIGVDDFAALRHLHASALKAHTLDVLSDDEIAAFVRLVYSSAYSDMLMQEEVMGGWIEDELVGTVSWHPAGNDGLTASIGGIFVRHPRLGIGRRLLAAAEACAQQRGFERLSCCATANAVPFFLRFGYEMASAGVRTLPLNCVLPVTFLRKPLARLRHALN